MNFQEKLYQLRKDRRLSQEQLAEVLGVSRQAVQKWETGSSVPDVSNLIALSNYFQISLDNLLKDDAGDFPAESNSKSDMSGSNQSEHPILYYRPHYEYKSKRTLFGLPLIHINVGRGFYKAKGIIAVGTAATGLISLGLLSIGLLSFGVLSLGLVAIAGLCVGVISIGGLSIGLVSLGGLAVGVLSVGGLSVGIYSIGGCAIGSHFAAGGYASAHIAVGDVARGTVQFSGDSARHLTAAQLSFVIYREYPDIWPFLVRFLTFFLP